MIHRLQFSVYLFDSGIINVLFKMYSELSFSVIISLDFKG